MTAPHTPARVAEVAGLRAAGLTHAAIADRTGIPRRSVTRILSRTPVADVVTAEVRQSMAEVVAETLDMAIAAVRRGLADPRARLGDAAQAVRILAEQLALLDGRATQNIALSGPGGDGRAVYVDTLSTEDKAALRDAIDRETRIRGIGDDDDALAAARAAYLAALHGRTGRVDVLYGLLTELDAEEAAELDARLGETPRLLLTEGTSWD